MAGPDGRTLNAAGGEGVFGGSLPNADEIDSRGPLAPRGGRARSVVVLLPALNEEMAVGSVLDRIPIERLRRSGYDVSVWVVDGKSTDATLRIARDRGASIFVQHGEGKGNGVRQALTLLMDGRHDRASEGPRVFIMLDADGSYPPEQIPGFVEALESGSDVVAGSRFLGHAEAGAITPLNLIGNRLLSRLARFLFRVPVTDVCSGMWAFREECLRHLCLVANNFDLEADLFASACGIGARRIELPIDYSRRIGDPKLIPLRTGLLIAWRLLFRRLNGRVRGTPMPVARVMHRGEADA